MSITECILPWRLNKKNREKILGSRMIFSPFEDFLFLQKSNHLCTVRQNKKMMKKNPGPCKFFCVDLLTAIHKPKARKAPGPIFKQGPKLESCIKLIFCVVATRIMSPMKTRWSPKPVEARSPLKPEARSSCMTWNWHQTTNYYS